MFLHVIAILSILLSNPTGSVQGMVYDLSSGEPAVCAVRLTSGELLFNDVNQANGFFIDSIQAGIYTLTLWNPSYNETIIHHFEVRPGQQLSLPDLFITYRGVVEYRTRIDTCLRIDGVKLSTDFKDVTIDCGSNSNYIMKAVIPSRNGNQTETPREQIVEYHIDFNALMDCP